MTTEDILRKNMEFVRNEALKLSVEEFADKLEISKSTYLRMKSERCGTEIKFSIIKRICELTGLSVDDFTNDVLTETSYHALKKTVEAAEMPKVKKAVWLKKGMCITQKKWVIGVSAFVVCMGIMASVVWMVSYNAVKTAAETVSLQTSVPLETPAAYEPEQIYYWTDRKGGSYHKNRDCPAIKNRNNIISGTLEEAKEMDKFDPCDFCVFPQ